MTKEQQALLELLSKALFSKHIDVGNEIDRGVLYAEARAQSVLPLAYRALVSEIHDAEAAKEWEEWEEWEARSKAILTKNIKVIRAHTLIDACMKKAGTPYVIIKGCASSSYYPEPALRTMGDVDFLVSPEKLEETGKFLEKRGFICKKSEHDAHVVYQYEGVTFEMHFDIARIPEGREGDCVREYLKDVIYLAREKSVEFGSAMLPSPFHHGLILLLHSAKHLVNGGIGLRHLCDWAVFASHFDDAEFRSVFEEKLKAAGLWRFAALLTGISVKYLGAPQRDWAGFVEEEAVDALMDDILCGGNFGRKEGIRRQERLFIPSRGAYKFSSKSVFSDFFRSINLMVYGNWPFFSKHKALLPAGWAALGVRRISRQLTGKRSKLFFKRAHTAAKERRALLDELRLFKEE